MGDQTADEYFSKIEAILTLLTDLGSDMSDDDFRVSWCQREESSFVSRSSVLHTGTTSSAPQVLLAEASSRNQTGWNNRERDNRTTTREVCRNFGRGFCRWGDACRFLHDSSRSSGTPRNSNNSTTHTHTQGTLPMHAGSQSGRLNVSQQQQLLQLLQEAQQTMLGPNLVSKWLNSGQSRPQLPPGLPFWSTDDPNKPQTHKHQLFLSGTVQGSTLAMVKPKGLLDPSNSTFSDVTANWVTHPVNLLS
ncbi:hybrid signal transduction histidine kinase M [Tanacetum coccineum]